MRCQTGIGRIFLLAIVLSCSFLQLSHAQDCASESALASSRGGDSIDASFNNSSPDRVRLYSIAARGVRLLSATIEPGTAHQQATFSGQVWVIADESDRCLQIAMPSSARSVFDIGGNAGAPSAATTLTEPLPSAPLPSEPLRSEPLSSEPLPVDPPVVPASAAQPTWQADTPYYITPRGDEAKRLNNQTSGIVVLSSAIPAQDSQQWEFEAVAGTPYVRLRNIWRDTVLAEVDGHVRATPSRDQRGSHWLLRPLDGTAYVEIVNRESQRLLLGFEGAAALGQASLDPASYWQVSRVNAGRAPQ